MKNLIRLFLTTSSLLFVSNSYGQDQPGFECDNNFGECGSPEQSGGGGNGGRSVLVQATDLGDTYQNADDYDNDGVGDMCDNCMNSFNPQQTNSNESYAGDACDPPEVHDAIVFEDPCSIYPEFYECENVPEVYLGNPVKKEIAFNDDDNFLYEEGCSQDSRRRKKKSLIAFFCFLTLLFFRQPLS